MVIDDAALPAACHLTGPDAREVLGAAVAAAGGRLHSSRPVQVQYRPGADLVVRYDARVAWADGRPIAETLVAGTVAPDRGETATDASIAFPGTLPLRADTPDGELDVAVWRWPFDPLVRGLGRAVTPSSIAPLLGADARQVHLEVVAYRPTERAVVRATTPHGVFYVKVVRPDTAAAVTRRHELLRDAGVPVPSLVATDHTDGIVVMDELGGESLRDQLKSGDGPWPTAAAYLELTDALASTTAVDQHERPGRVRDGIGHTRLLRSIVPDQAERLDRLVDRLQGAASRSDARRGPVIHGDLYEAQLRVDGDRIVGVLDIDDVGPGDPLDDLANVLAHLHRRCQTTTDGARATRLRGYARALRRDIHDRLIAADRDPSDLDLVTGAALLGLATGPFRIQQRNWDRAVRAQIEIATTLIDDERSLLGTSSTRHQQVRER